MIARVRRHLIAAGAAGAAVASAALVVLMLLARPYDHFAVMSGAGSLSAAQWKVYAGQVTKDLSWDGVYLLGHALTWVGYGALLAVASRAGATLVVALGFLGVGLDFAENEMRWASLKAALAGAPLPLAELAHWQVMAALSYWSIFVAAILAGVLILALRARGGMVLAALAFAAFLVGPSTYRYGPLAAFVWVLTWHAATAVFLALNRDARLRPSGAHEPARNSSRVVG